ncbi:hypothetical protein [Paenibacillus radicis (ex Xue et al. 2023)]|uniref:Aminoacyl-transfer RNA synthetases class-II family profile domain-containing protein n=1 Tax=Paenibacillus radicis (ex Xue et al. 2023) TaxID=2972489 RepID=A0ABT1YKE1_9BACL|nr:hypothetical protein [Paenibacillus radicis (ex Xue et al. 2023)]MCR8632445.1 hypothetical protein [Paenibacillus radicis (ex Xue et al. 2023)]
MECVVSLEGLASSQHGQVKYAAAFIDENIRDIRIDNNHIYITHESAKSNEAIEAQVLRLIERFSHGDFGFKENILFENKVDTPYEGNIISELVDRKIIKILDPGLFIFREPFSSLMRFLDYSFVTKVANRFTEVKEESYPAVIHCDTLNKTNHFTSFPEHIHFLTHLREDLDIIESFSQSIRDAGGWKQDAPLDLNANMPTPKFTMNPSTCYHCYEGLQNETLEGDGLIVTAISKCHRFESRNHSDFGRLLDFSMREIIFVGKPEFVKENRLRSIEYIKELAVEWNVDSLFEIANDPFFTNDFQTKASFQRNQEMKYELRLNIPYINKSIACSSVNFHSNTFGTAFNIKMGKRNAVTGCVGFGIERWAFAFLAQYSLDEAAWPAAFREQYHAWQQKSL